MTGSTTGLHGWQVQFITHSEIRVYNIVAKFDDRAGWRVQFITHSKPGNAHSHVQSIFSVYTWLMRDKLTMRLQSGLFKR